MKSYEIEIKRTSYISITVEADSTEEAEEKAWEELAGGYDEGGHADWEIESIEEEEIATDETRSYGSQGETA
jgi:hypothetical protein